MPDKKPTDNEIVKALEICGKGIMFSKHDCKKCPYYTELNCETKCKQNALDLINRQKAEKEDIKFLYENLKEEHLEIIKAIKYTKAEAYKEFAEKLEERIAVHLLKNKSNQYAEGFADALDGVNGEIDNLLKELIKELIGE